MRPRHFAALGAVTLSFAAAAPAAHAISLPLPPLPTGLPAIGQPPPAPTANVISAKLLCETFGGSFSATYVLYANGLPGPKPTLVAWSCEGNKSLNAVLQSGIICRHTGFGWVFNVTSTGFPFSYTCAGPNQYPDE